MKAASIPTSTGEPAPGDVARAALSSIRGNGPKKAAVTCLSAGASNCATCKSAWVWC